MTTLDLLLAAGFARADAERATAPPPDPSHDLEAAWPLLRGHLAVQGDLVRRLPARPSRSAAEQAAAATLLEDGRSAREAFLARQVGAIYDRLTRSRRRLLRLRELVYLAAEEYPGLVPGAEEVLRERERPLPEQDGVQIDQGIFFAHVFADRERGLHLIHAMGQPTLAALDRLPELRRTGRIELATMTLAREGDLGRVTFRHQAWLNAEDDDYQRDFELLVDLVLLDEGIRVGVLRGAPMTKEKYAGRRVFGAGINLTRLYHGQISLVDFMLTRETGPLTKIQRGLAAPEPDPEAEHRTEKAFIAAVDAFAIGGHCQMLLVVDRVIAQRGVYFNLPARKEGIVPGLANLRLPRFVGERAARQGIFFDRSFPADGPDGALLCDEVVDGDDAMEAAILRSAAELGSAGATSFVANRRAHRAGAEPIDLFRRYMSVYSREQARCMHSSALVDNLVRNWNAKERRIG